MKDMTGTETEQDDITSAVEAWERHKRIDLVFEGGGVLGIGLVGAYSVLEERAFRPQNVAGTSAGAIVATLIAAGYTAAAIREIIFDLPFEQFTDPTWAGQLPLVGKTRLGQGLSLLWEHGLHKGDFFHQTMRRYLEAKEVRTFGQLVYDPSLPPASPYRYKVQVIASDVTGRRLLRLPLDAHLLGYEPDELPVADAIRMSMSIPFFFRPVRHTNPQTNQRQVIVDGGMLSNFPVWLFDSPGVPEWPTFGLKLVAADPADDRGRGPSPAPLPGDVGGLMRYGWSLVETMMRAHDQRYMDNETFARTITIPTGSLSSTNFRLSDQDKTHLYEAGRAAATVFLDEHWSYAEYLATFRTGPTPSRRQVLKSYTQQRAAEKGLAPHRPRA
jgi:NTE family protein